VRRQCFRDRSIALCEGRHIKGEGKGRVRTTGFVASSSWMGRFDELYRHVSADAKTSAERLVPGYQKIKAFL
jgi:hypothetical protein